MENEVEIELPYTIMQMILFSMVKSNTIFTIITQNMMICDSLVLYSGYIKTEQTLKFPEISISVSNALPQLYPKPQRISSIF